MTVKKIRKRLFAIVFILLTLGFIIPQNFQIPVQGASKADYNKDSYWYYPWGRSVTHKGVDIFAERGRPINSSVKGIVIGKGFDHVGGNRILILGPKWRLHYYAHLAEIKVNRFDFVNHKTVIGTVGDSGNAKGKPPHLHYSIATPIPYPWRIDNDHQGWLKMFYLNPIKYIEAN